MQYSLEHICALLNGKLIGNLNQSVEQIVFDTRMAFRGDKVLFVAIKTQNSDGHLFIDEAYEKGCRIFLIDQDVPLKPDATYISVENTLEGLQLWAEKNIELFSGIVIGITGSLGKTTVKEWLFEILPPNLKVFKSPKSYNSQLGVALSALMLDLTADIAIFEAGISQPNEMANLARIIKPNIGLITNLAEPHQANFAGYDEKLNEKLQLFHHADLLLFCQDDVRIQQAINTRFPSKKKLSWGKSSIASVVLKKVEENDIIIEINKNIYTIKIASSNAYHVENIMHCVLVCMALEISIESIIDHFQHLKPLPMRLEMKQGKHDILLVNDSYSADFLSLKVALDYLNKVAGVQAKTLIVSAFDDQNITVETYLSNLSNLVEQYGLSRLVLIGQEFSTLNRDMFSVQLAIFPTTDEFLENNHPIDFSAEAILIKGARKYKLEKIIYHFQEKSHPTMLEINLSALKNNFSFFKNIVGPNTKIMVMLKALGYGAGSFELARLLHGLQVDYLAVAFIDEGVLLRKRGITLPILVLSPDREGFANLIEYFLEPEIYSFDILNDLLTFLQDEQLIGKVKIHINIDTGMHRLGFALHEAENLLFILQKHDAIIEVASVFTHLVASEDFAHDAFTKKQLILYEKAVKIFEEGLHYTFLKHVANTGGSLRHPDARYNMIRLGIGFYGIDPSNIHNKQLQLAFRWLTRVSQVISIKKGESVGYNRKWMAQRDSQIATIPIGYADGLSRLAGNENASVYYQGKALCIIGSVCMDMAMIDATDMQIKVGDEIVVFENQIQLENLCKAQNTIPYEVLASISSRVKRIYVEE